MPPQPMVLTPYSINNFELPSPQRVLPRSFRANGSNDQLTEAIFVPHYIHAKRDTVAQHAAVATAAEESHLEQRNSMMSNEDQYGNEEEEMNLLTPIQRKRHALDY